MPHIATASLQANHMADPTTDWNMISAFSTALAAGGTILASITSVGVWWATHRMLKTSQQALDDARAEAGRNRAPQIEIAVWPKPGQPVLMLSVRNVGNGAARNLKLTLDHNFYFNGEDGEAGNLRNYAVFSERIDSLAPRAEIDMMLGVGHKIFSRPDLCPLKFMIEAKYSFEQREVIERTFIDIAPFNKHLAAEDLQVAQLKKLTAAVEDAATAIRLSTEAARPRQ